jgi:glycosyltransferase involved in cell wall biosynthesis
LVVYSALAAKCPVVASNFPGIAETIQHGQNGLLFAPGDVQSLADQLDALLSDATLQPRLSAQCNSPKSMETYVDELLEIWLTEGRQQVPTVERIPDVVGHSVEAAG